MHGIIVYEPSAASQQGWYINEYIKNMAGLGHELKLVTTDMPEDMESADFAIIRTMAPLISKRLEERGVRCYNNAQVCALSADKGKAYQFVAENTAVPFMPLMKEPVYPLVFKKRFCHGGTDVHYIRDEIGLHKTIYKIFGEAENRENVEDLGLHKEDEYILQKPCDTPGIDVRVYILGGKIRAAMKRINPQASDAQAPYEERFKSNYCLGGRAEIYDIGSDEEMLDYVNQIVSKLDIDFAGIDFIFHQGHPVFNELESVAGARMLYGFTDVDIVKEFCVLIGGEAPHQSVAPTAVYASLRSALNACPPDMQRP